MELPDDVLAIIKDYSRPITRPDWRRIRRMTLYRFHYYISVTHNNMNIPVINSFTERYDQSHYRYVFGQGVLFQPIVHIIPY